MCGFDVNFNVNLEILVQIPRFLTKLSLIVLSPKKETFVYIDFISHPHIQNI